MAKFNAKFQAKKGPSQRQLRVGEEIRHALSSMFMRAELNDPAVRSTSITVSEVRISPDLRNATAFIMPLSGENKEEVLQALQERHGIIRTLITSKLNLKFSPRLHFKLDGSYDEASHIEGLLREARARDGQE